MEENWHGRIFREKSGSFNKCDAVPKTAIFQLWADFDGNLALGFLIKLYIMIEQPFFDKPAKTACPGKIWLTFENFFRATRRLFWMIHSVIGNFLEFGPSDHLEIAYFDTTKWS